MWALKSRRIDGIHKACSPPRKSECSSPLSSVAGRILIASAESTRGGVWCKFPSLQPQLSHMWVCARLSTLNLRGQGLKHLHRCYATIEASNSSPRSGPGAYQKQIQYSPFHTNIEEFARRIVPTEEEKKLKYQVIDGVKQSVKKAFENDRKIGKVTVQPFGSLVSGLSTWNSDVDMVVTGILQPDKATGGFPKSERQRVASQLDRIAMQLKKNKQLQVARLMVIRGARIPLIKMRTRTGVTVDISLGDESGPRAAKYLTQQVRSYPPVRPLVLVLKTLLKLAGLNEVQSGGLSSYSLTNMVIAHLQTELKEGHEVHDLGETMYGFLLRFGEEFNYETDAVSVAYGGIVPKSYLGFSPDHRLNSLDDDAVPAQARLCVDDPLTGRDISQGTYRIDMVQSCFQRAARKLQQLAQGRSLHDHSINYLTALFDPVKMCRRRPVIENEDEIEMLMGGTQTSRMGSSDEEATVYSLDDNELAVDDDYDPRLLVEQVSAVSKSKAPRAPRD